jgi:ceramide glucosyltransferase
VLVARLLGQAEFALGSTMVFRADALRRIGGFETIAKYVADDYQLGVHIRQLGYRIEFAPVVVETDLGAARGRTPGATRCAGRGPSGCRAGRILRLRGDARHALGAGGFRRGGMVGRRARAGGSHDCRECWWARRFSGSAVLARFWLIPLRDLFGFAVWAAGAFGNRVQWRDRSLILEPGGVIHTIDRGKNTK